jgi:hypothetical protein
MVITRYIRHELKLLQHYELLLIQQVLMSINKKVMYAKFNVNINLFI